LSTSANALTAIPDAWLPATQYDEDHKDRKSRSFAHDDQEEGSEESLSSQSSKNQELQASRKPTYLEDGAVFLPPPSRLPRGTKSSPTHLWMADKSQGGGNMNRPLSLSSRRNGGAFHVAKRSGFAMDYLLIKVGRLRCELVDKYQEVHRRSPH
jgi:hypothetical protein